MAAKTIALFGVLFTALAVGVVLGVAELKGSKSEFSPDTLEFRCSYFIYDEAFCYKKMKIHSELMEIMKKYKQEGDRREIAERWHLARGEKFRTRGWHGPAKHIANRINDPTLINWSEKNLESRGLFGRMLSSFSTRKNIPWCDCSLTILSSFVRIILSR